MITIRQFLQRDEDQDPLFPSSNEVSYPLAENEELLRYDSTESTADLNQVREIPSLISPTNFLRHWHYTNFVTRFALLGIKHKSETATLPASVKPAVRLFWLSGAGIPLETWSKIRLVNSIQDFFNYACFIITGLEPAILASLLLHDLSSYSFFPDERCGNSFSDILLGTATNQVTWSRHFGSDVLHELGYWTWLSALLLPPMTGLVAAFFQDRQRELIRHLDGPELINKLATTLSILNKEEISYKEALLSLFPCGRVRTTLTQVKFMLLWDGRKRDDENVVISLHIKEALVANLIELAHPSNYFLIRYQAMHLLAQIAASFHSKNLERFIEDPAQQVGLSGLRENILRALKTEPWSELQTSQLLTEIEGTFYQPSLSSEEMNDPVLRGEQMRGGLARYFSWTLGEERRALTQLFWIPSLLSSLYTLYSTGRYIQLMVTKIMDLVDHFHHKLACETEGKHFNFLKQSERYECVVCDWPFVNYRNSFTAQGCLEGLLQQNMSAVELHHHLIQMPSMQGISTIDFSQQTWSAWPVADWEQLLITLESMAVAPLELLNVSRSMEYFGNDVSLTRQHIQALAQLLTRINVTCFDISHQFLRDEFVNLLLNPLAETQLDKLYLVDTNLSDISATFLANLISGHLPNLNNLQLADNQITDFGIQKISEALHNSSLNTLNVADNPFFDKGLKKLAQGIQQSVVQTLDLSGHHFASNGLRVFSDTLKTNSNLRSLTISNAALTGEHIAGLQACLKSLEYLDVSNNLLENKDIQFLLRQARSYLKTLNVAGNQLTDAGSAMIAEDLPASSLQHLDISGNKLTQQGFTPLARVLPRTQLLSFTCVECQLNDQDIEELAAVFSNPTLLLRSLNLNDNEITHITLIKWLEVLPKTNLHELHLMRNKINSRSAPRLARVLSKTNLTFLDLSHNFLDGSFLKELIPVLHQSHLQQLILNDNRFAGKSLNNFAKELVQLPCHIHDLNAAQLSRQAKRVFYPMKPNTALTQLNVINNDLDIPSIRSFCRVASSLPNIRFLEPERMQHLDWRSCEILPAKTMPVVRAEQANVLQSNQLPPMKTTSMLLNSSFLISLICGGGILCLMALLYASYRAGRSTYRFFRPVPPRLSSVALESDEIIPDHNIRQSYRP
jgi:Ran GTPase-activating protein (RanGAP) involved in mRNA processing and transport